MLVGSSAMVFFSGMPSDAVGPVVDKVTPTVISATADAAAPAKNKASRLRDNLLIKITPAWVDV
jgi:hypothetical protein